MPDFELHYSVFGGYPVIEASLTVASNDQAEMFLGSSWSLPGEELDHAGWFGGPIPAEVMTDLSQMFAAPAARENILRLQAAQAGKLPFDALVRILRLVWEGKEFKLDLSASASDAWVSQLEELLRRAMSILNGCPRLALRLHAGLRQEDKAFMPSIQVTGLGAQ